MAINPISEQQVNPEPITPRGPLEKPVQFIRATEKKMADIIAFGRSKNPDMILQQIITSTRGAADKIKSGFRRNKQPTVNRKVDVSPDTLNDEEANGDTIEDSGKIPEKQQGQTSQEVAGPDDGNPQTDELTSEVLSADETAKRMRARYLKRTEAKKTSQLNPDSLAQLNAAPITEITLPNGIKINRPENSLGEQSRYPDQLTGASLLNYLTEFIDREKLLKGVYTEIHAMPSGELFVTPEVVDSSQHYASLSGNHSMWQIKDIYQGSGITTLETGVLQRLPFNTDTLVAKGTLTYNQEKQGYKLDVFPYLREQDFARITNQPIVDGELLARIVKERKVLGLEAVSGRQDGKVDLEYVDDPKVYSGVEYQPDPSKSIRSGLIYDLNYYEKYGASNTEVRAESVISFDIKEAAVATHKEAAKIIASRYSQNIDQNHPFPKAEIDIGDDTFGVEGRHSLTSEGGQINLIISSPVEEVESQKFRNLEYAYYLSYLRALLRKNEKLQETSITLITSYVAKGGKTAYHTISIQPSLLADLNSDQSDTGIISSKQLFSLLSN